jgi:hypothetical protein
MVRLTSLSGFFILSGKLIFFEIQFTKLRPLSGFSSRPSGFSLKWLIWSAIFCQISKIDQKRKRSLRRAQTIPKTSCQSAKIDEVFPRGPLGKIALVKAVIFL